MVLNGCTGRSHAFRPCPGWVSQGPPALQLPSVRGVRPAPLSLLGALRLESQGYLIPSFAETPLGNDSLPERPARGVRSSGGMPVDLLHMQA